MRDQSAGEELPRGPPTSDPESESLLLVLVLVLVLVLGDFSEELDDEGCFSFKGALSLA